MTEEMSWEVKKAIKDEKTKKEVQSAVKVIIKNLNTYGDETLVGNAIKDEIANTHRTLQQGFFRNVIVPVVLQYAKQKKEGWVDLRNEDSCNCAEKLEPILKDSYFRLI